MTQAETAFAPSGSWALTDEATGRQYGRARIVQVVRGGNPVGGDPERKRIPLDAEPERRFVLEMFDAYSVGDVHDRVSDVLHRDMARFKAWVASLSDDERRRIAKANWEKRRNDPVRYGAKKKQNAARELAKYRALTPDERRSRNAAYWQALKANPERLAARREYNREQMRRLRERRKEGGGA